MTNIIYVIRDDESCASSRLEEEESNIAEEEEPTEEEIDASMLCLGIGSSSNKGRHYFNYDLIKKFSWLPRKATREETLLSTSSVNPTLPSDGESEILGSSNLRSFSLKELEIATKNFDPSNLLGEGPFASVFKGTIVKKRHGRGIVVAVKRLHEKKRENATDWLNYNAKLSFGEAEGYATGIETIRGVQEYNLDFVSAYTDPECFDRGLTAESDVYSFGVLLLEILFGQRLVDPGVKLDFFTIRGEKCRFVALANTLEGRFRLRGAQKDLYDLALLCLREPGYSFRDKGRRITMDKVVIALESVNNRIDVSDAASDNIVDD